MPSLRLQLKFEKATKNTYRFASDNPDAAITTVYIEKAAFTKQPESVELIVNGDALKSV